MKITVLLMIAVLLATTAHAGPKGLASAVNNLAAAAESGVTRARFFELLGNATEQAQGWCETPADAQRNPNWYCVAYLQFKVVGMSWYAMDKADKGSLEAAVRAAKMARQTGGKVSK